jgi:hypothetical protein
MAITRPAVKTPWGDSAPGEQTEPTALLPNGYPNTTPKYKPIRQHLNWLFNYAMNGLRYLSLRGIAEWNAGEAYSVGDIVRDANGVIYRLVLAAAAGTVVSNQLYWQIVSSSPKFGVLNLDQPAHVFTDADRRAISGADHLGFPVGRFFVIDEKWDSHSITSKTVAGSGLLYGDWNYGIFGGNGEVRGVTNGVAADRDKYPLGDTLAIGLASAVAATASVIERRDDLPLLFFTKEAVVFEWSWATNLGTLGFPQSNMSIALGIGDGTLVAGGSVNTIEATGFPTGAGVYKKAGQDNWWTWVKPPGVAVSTHDTGIGSIDSQVNRLRVEVVGVDADAEDGTARVSVYMNGVLQQTTSADMEGEGLFPFARMSFAGPNDPRRLYLGRPRTVARDISGAGIY